MEGKMYGYVNSADRQKADRQITAMWAFGVKPQDVFVEKALPEGIDAPAYREAARVLGENDTLVVADFEALGKDSAQLADRWRQITIEKRAGIIVLELPVANTGLGEDELGKVIARITLGVMQHFDRSRSFKKKRQAEGIAEARANGVRLGRRPKEIPEEFEDVRQKCAGGELTVTAAAKALGVDAHTYRKWVRMREQEACGRRKG